MHDTIEMDSAVAHELWMLGLLGERMRLAQKDYFHSRSSAALERARHLEKRFDSLLYNVMARARGETLL
jgi:hypothetical protein